MDMDMDMDMDGCRSDMDFHNSFGLQILGLAF